MTAPAVDGRANEALCLALADALHVSRRDVRIVSGTASRDKIVSVPSAEVAARVAALIGNEPGDQGEWKS